LNRSTILSQSEGEYSSDLILNTSSYTGCDIEEPPPGMNSLIPGQSVDIIDDLDDLLEREDDDDVETYDIEYILAEEGGELEINDNEIEIPEYALEQDTLMVFYIPNSDIIEYWIFPCPLSFEDSVQIKLSYEFALLNGIDEENISIVQWIPQLQGWDDLGGVVDTVKNVVRLKILEFNPPIEDSSYIRYALADHN
jgi:hypothetical protein